MSPVSRQTSKGSRYSRSRAGSNLSGAESRFADLHLGTASRSRSVSTSGSSYQPQQQYAENPSYIQGAFTPDYLPPGLDSGSSAVGSAFDPSRSRLRHSHTEAWPAFTSTDSLESDLPRVQLDPGAADYGPNASFGQGSAQIGAYTQEDMNAYGYVLPQPMAHFGSQAPYASTLYPSVAAYDLNRIPNPQSRRTSATRYQADAPSFHGQPLPSSTSHPGLRTEDSEITRQRRRSSQDSRRLSRTRMRRDRSPGEPYSRPSSRQDLGLAMNYASTSSMVSPALSTASESSTYSTQLLGSSVVAGAQPYYGDVAAGQYEMSKYHMAGDMTTGGPQQFYDPSSSYSIPVTAEYEANAYQHTSSIETASSSPGLDGQVRVVGARPKPQCWEHGCNGRQFSTFSNLLRHQREKSGTAAKSYCPKCGAEFTRTTARNGHMAHEKCRPRGQSDY